MTLGKRTKGRQLLVQALYAAEMSGTDLLDCLEQQIERRGPSPETAVFVRRLAAEIAANRADLDAKFSELLQNWDLARVGQVEQAICRLGLAELIHHPEVPARVALDEACELARLFCGEEAVKFVNGVLDRAAREALEQERGGDASPAVEEER